MIKITPKEKKKLMNTCSWCKKRVRKNAKIVFSISAKVREEVDLKDYEGQYAGLSLPDNKTIHAYVTTSDSLAKLADQDLKFIACSQECNRLLCDALQKEINLIDSIT